MSPSRPLAAAARPAAIAAPARRPVWHVRLLGAVEARSATGELTRWPSRAVAALLARLALAPDRAHPREELIELLWPGVALEIGRNRLRQTLSTLKSLLEPASAAPAAPVLLADRRSIRAVAGALACDAPAFEDAVRAGRGDEARRLYRGELMPGYYDDWIDCERERLRALADRARAADGAARQPRTVAPEAPGTLVSEVMPADPEAGRGPKPLARLPAYLTPLFGAEHAAARLRVQVLQHRLVSIVGPGGSGKTRLAVEVAQAFDEALVHGGAAALAGLQQLEPAAPRGGFDRVVFVAAADCRGAGELHDAIAAAVQGVAAAGARRAGDPTDPEALAAWLDGVPALVVLDNCEQFGDDALGLVARLLARVAPLHVLATSRRALNLDGEHCLAAEPLPLPATDSPLAAAAANPAVALFVDRARAARAEFHLGRRNHADVVALVRALDGLPLAIELAASRIRTHTPREMARAFGGGSGVDAAVPKALDLLGPRGGRGAALARHASMERAIDASWRLLAARERAALGALALLHGEPDAAALGAALALAPTEARSLVDALAAHSLLRPLPSPAAAAEPADAGRYALAQPVREFAAARVDPAAATLQRARLRRWLTGWVLGLGSAALPAALAPRRADLHAALVASDDDDAAREVLGLALALAEAWERELPPAHVVDALDDACRRVAAALDAPTAVAVHDLLAQLRFETGAAERALVHAEAALAAAADAPGLRARALLRRAGVELAAGRSRDLGDAAPAAIGAMLDEALALARRATAPAIEARALQALATHALYTHRDAARAERHAAAAQALWTALGERRRAYAALRQRAQCWRRLGRADEALATYRACEAAALAEDDVGARIDALLAQAALLGDRRRSAEGLEVARRCIALCWQHGHGHGLAYSLWYAAALHLRQGEAETALRLIAFAARYWRTCFGALSPGDLRHVEALRRLVRRAAGRARAEALEIDGASLTLSQAVALALGEATPSGSPA